MGCSGSSAKRQEPDSKYKPEEERTENKSEPADEQIKTDGKGGKKKQAKAKAAIGKSPKAGAKSEAHLVNHRKKRDKGKNTKDLIKTALKNDRVCGNLEEQDMDIILETMEYFTFKGGEPIVKQGDEGTYFFVTHEGALEVTVNGKIINKMTQGMAFGGLALLYNCPRTATVTAKEDCALWGASGETFHRVLRENTQKNQAANRKFIDAMSVFDGLTQAQKNLVGSHLFVEVFEPGTRVVTEGEPATSMYFVKKGELRVIQGGRVSNQGRLDGGEQISQLRPGDVFGERAVLYNEPRGSTVIADTKSELLTIGVEQLKDVLGSDLVSCLERNFILSNVKKSQTFAIFSGAQLLHIVKKMDIRSFRPNDDIQEGLRFAVVMEGELTGYAKDKEVTLDRSRWWESDNLQDDSAPARTTTSALGALGKKGDLHGLKAGKDGAKVAILSTDMMKGVLDFFGMTEVDGQAGVDYTRKMLLLRKVPLFRHLSANQSDHLVKSLSLQKYKSGAAVIKQGEFGQAFFVIASGEVRVLINGNMIRTMGKTGYFGERSLLFSEPRSATVEVSSTEAELWSIEKATFDQIITKNMRDELEHRIRLQDVNVTLKDLKHVRLIGAGAAGVVRLVEHVKTKTRYALKRVNKENGRVPEEVTRECALLAENDHPFIVRLVKNLETKSSIYMLMEVVPGGELFNAIRSFDEVLTTAQAQFYTGSIILVLESLRERGIVYRDLKPENVMLDAQGYLKLIDFGIARKLDESGKAYTVVGTPHYMAPEVIRGHGYGTEVDIWSLGVMQFEFVCGYLPFGDDLEDVSEVCAAVLKEPLSIPGPYKIPAGKTLMQGILAKKPQRRLGAGINGFEDLKEAEYFKIGHEGGSSNLFNKIMGREFAGPVVPPGETYGDAEDLRDCSLSDAGELYTG